MKPTPPRLPFLLALALAAAPLACRKPAPEETAPPAPVEATAPRTLLLGEWTELDGTTQPLPQHSARVSAAIEGRVASVLTDAEGKPVQEGQTVHAGDVVARLDDRIARANRDKLEAGLKEMGEQLKQAEYAVQLAQVEVDRLDDLMKRRSSAGGLQLVSQVDVDKARLNLKDAQSRQRGVVAHQEATAKELKALDEQLALYTLRAPIGGRLGLLQVMPGQTLSVGAPVADVVDLDEIEALCYVAPHAAARLAVGQPARLVLVKPDGRQDVGPADGKVVFRGVQAQPDSGNFPVKVRFPNKNLRVLANAVVRVQVQTQPEKERLTIPASALMEYQEPPAVIVVQKPAADEKKGEGEARANQPKEGEGKEGAEEKLVARRLQATVGVRDSQWHVVELLGLYDPDKKERVPLEDVLVVTKGGHGLRNDDPVRIASEEDEGDEK